MNEYSWYVVAFYFIILCHIDAVRVQSSSSAIPPRSSSNAAVITGPVVAVTMLITALTVAAVVVTLTMRNCQQIRRRDTKQTR